MLKNNINMPFPDSLNKKKITFSRCNISAIRRLACTVGLVGIGWFPI